MDDELNLFMKKGKLLKNDQMAYFSLLPLFLRESDAVGLFVTSGVTRCNTVWRWTFSDHPLPSERRFNKAY